MKNITESLKNVVGVVANSGVIDVIKNKDNLIIAAGLTTGAALIYGGSKVLKAAKIKHDERIIKQAVKDGKVVYEYSEEELNKNNSK